jgi:hypothetical protein
MNAHEETAKKVLSELLAADRALASDTPASEHPDEAAARLVNALGSADALVPSGPVAAAAKIWACLKGGEIAFDTECNLKFAEAKNLLLELFLPGQVSIDNA